MHLYCAVQYSIRPCIQCCYRKNSERGYDTSSAMPLAQAKRATIAFRKSGPASESLWCTVIVLSQADPRANVLGLSCRVSYNDILLWCRNVFKKYYCISPMSEGRASLPMGQGFVGLARALRWAGLGSLGWVTPEPGLPGEPDECFCLRFVLAILLNHDYYGNQSLSTWNSGTVFTFRGKVEVELCSNGDNAMKSYAEQRLVVLDCHSF